MIMIMIIVKVISLCMTIFWKEKQIGNDVWIGSGTIILKGAKNIGDRCVIEQETIVKGIIPEDSIVYDKEIIKYNRLSEKRSFSNIRQLIVCEFRGRRADVLL